MPNEKITIELTIEELKFLQVVCKDYEKTQKSISIVMGAAMMSMCGLTPDDKDKDSTMKMMDNFEKKHMTMEASNCKTAQDLTSIFRNKINEAHFQSATAGGKS